MNAAEEIKQNVSMYDVLEQYGYVLNRTGAMSCPFHEEKTPSFRVYHNGTRWHCFGCGSGGTVIDFIMQLFHLDFYQAIVRLNMDFNLGLCGQRPSLRERQRIAQEKARKARELFEYREGYKANISRFRRLWYARKEQAPQSAEEQRSPAFLESLLYLEYLEYWLEATPWR